jgi:hypothetical protein
MFENDQTDFVIPMGLYTARLESLERALSSGESSPEIEAYYAEDGSPNDSELTHYKGVVKDHSRTSDDLSGPNLCSSGYRSLVVEWEDGTSDEVSPWEVNVCASAESSQPNRPSLTDEEKKSVFKALAALKDLPNVKAFMTRVDERRYSDYASRIEIPMDLTFITNRLEADYYATRSDVVADVKLIRENCAKYNGANDELTISASEMLEKFEGLVLSDEERQSYLDFEAAVVANIPQRDTNQQDVDVPVDSGATRRSVRSQRQVQSRSSLENLPEPRTVRIRMGGTERRSQPSRRIDPPANLSSRSRRSTRSVLEIAPAASTSQRAPSNRQPARAAGRHLSNQNEQLDQLPRRGRRSLGQVNAGNASNSSQQLQGSESRVSSRARTLRGAASVDSAPHPQRHSARTSAPRGVYVDQPSEPEDSEDESDMSEGQHIESAGRAQSSRKRSSKVPARADHQEAQTEDSDDSAGATGLAQRSLRRSSRAPARATDKDSDIKNMEESEHSAGANNRGQSSRSRPSRAPARARDQDSDADDSDASGDATRPAQPSLSRPSRAPTRAAALDPDIESDEDSEASSGEKEASSGSDEELVVSDGDDSDASSEPKKRASQRSSPSRARKKTYADLSCSEEEEEEYESKPTTGSRKRKAVVTSKSKKGK